jgi:hypothetical protein
MGIKLLIEWNAEFSVEWVLSKNNHPSSIQIISILCSNCNNSEPHFLPEQKIRHFAYIVSRKKLDNRPCHNKS